MSFGNAQRVCLIALVDQGLLSGYHGGCADGLDGFLLSARWGRGGGVQMCMVWVFLVGTFNNALGYSALDFWNWAWLFEGNA